MSIELSANDIVPEEYQMRLMAWRDEFTRGYFEIGDIANEIVLINVQRGMQVDQNSIYAAVGKFCGKSGRTVRDYAEVAAFFPVTVRDEYDVLPFSHFRFAKSCGLRFREVLDSSLDNPSMSVEALEISFGRRPDSYGAAGVILAINPMESPWPPPHSNTADNPKITLIPQIHEVYALANLISQTERILSWDIKKDIRAELLSSLEGLKHVLACLSAGGELPADILVAADVLASN